MLEKMGRSTGFEPATSGTTNRRSNQLSYDRHNIQAHMPRGGLLGVCTERSSRIRCGREPVAQLIPHAK